MDTMFEEVREILSAEAQFPFTLRLEAIWGGDFAALRPADPSGFPLFSIVLVPSRLRAEAHFVPDTFAGALVRQMSDNLALSPVPWVEYIRDQKDRVDVVIRIDDLVVGPNEIPDCEWKRIEIECTTQYERRDLIESRRNAFVDAVSTCLTLVLLSVEGDPDKNVNQTIGPEGSQIISNSTRYERSPANRLRCLQYWGRSCWVCDFDFGARYGDLGAGFIEVHHLTPLAAGTGLVVVDPRSDLVPLCSNCHSMAHRSSMLNPMHPVELRRLLSLPEKQWPDEKVRSVD